MQNIHPVDELNSIRAQIKLLQSREKEIREMLLSGECSPRGDIFMAHLNEVSYSRIDPALVRKALPEEMMPKVMRQIVQTNIRLQQIADPIRGAF